MSSLADVILGNPDDTARVPQLRQGIVTSASPIMVQVGAAATSLACRVLASYVPTVGDVVSVLVISGDRLVLGRASQQGAGPPVDTTQFVRKTGDTMTGTLNINAPAGLYCTGDTYGSRFILAGSSLGFYWSGDPWIRTISDGSIWVASGRFGGQGGLTLGWNGGGNDQGHIADINGYLRLTQRADLGALNVAGESSVAHLVTSHVDTRDGYRVVSNGSYDGWYYNAGFFCQRASNGDRAHYSTHPGGVAYNWGANSASPGWAAWTLDCSGYCYVSLADILIGSSRRFKEAIAPWPARSVGAAVLGAAERLHLIDVVQYRQRKELGLLSALDDRRRAAFERLNAYRARRGLDPHPWPLHDCDVEACTGTAVEPCSLVRNWENPTIGVIAEELIDVLPEAVTLNEEGAPEGVRGYALIGYLLAVCKEQQERIEQLEAHVAPRLTEVAA